MNVLKLVKPMLQVASKNTPMILTTVGVASLLGSIVYGVYETPKILRLLESAKEENQDLALTRVEVAKTVCRPLLPSIILGGIGVACFVVSYRVQALRGAALLAALKLTTQNFEWYKGFSRRNLEWYENYMNKNKELGSGKNHKIIKEQIRGDDIKKKPVVDSEVVVVKSGVLCYDTLGGRYFESDKETIREAINNLNSKMYVEDGITLNDLYCELGLPAVHNGERMGWEIGGGHIDPDFSSHLTSDGRPCLALGFYNEPRYTYEDN